MCHGRTGKASLSGGAIMRKGFAIVFSALLAIGCATQSKQASRPVVHMTPEQIEAQRKADEELLRQNNEKFSKAYANHPEAFVK